MMKYNLGIDLGGTNIKVGVVDENFQIVAKANLKTNLPKPDAEIADDIATACRLAVREAGITLDDVNSIGIGTPGVADRNSGIVLYSCNLGFENTNLRGLLENRLGKSIYIENDANAAAYGEAIAGAAKGYQNVVVITLGTGVGGGVIIDGKIYTGFNYCGAELGHTVIVYGGRECGCGRKGCFEAYASASALIYQTQEAMKAHPDSKMWEIAGSLEDVDGKTAFDGMRAGDKTASDVVEMYINYLGCGLVDMINIFQPEILLIGGGICKEGDNLLTPLKKIIERDAYCINPRQATRLGIAQLGNDAGIIGAAFLHHLDQ